MKTKAYHAFQQKILYFNDDIDLIDVVRIGILKGELTDAGGKGVLKYIDVAKHNHIKRRKNSDNSRKLLINHLRHTVYAAYVKDVYEEVTLYFRTILRKAAENGFDAGRIIGEHSFKLDAKSVLETGNWQLITQTIADSVFQALEAEKSTLKLFEKISNKLALGIDPEQIKKALPYLEVRHFLVHADGAIPEDFRRDNPGIRVERGYVKLDYEFISNLSQVVCELLSEYDRKIVAANLLGRDETQP